MTKHPTSSRVHRDDQVPDDAFVSSVKKIISWGKENRREVILGAAALVVVAGAAVYMIVQQRNVESTAQARLSQVQQTVASGNVQLAINDLQSFLETFGSTETADQARLTLADLLIGQDRPDEAVEALGDLPQRLDEPFGLAAARLEAAALELMERYNEAVEAYREIARNARFPYQRREAYADAARIELQNGDASRAVTLFEQVLATFDDDAPAQGYYEMWLAEARAQARAGQGTAQDAQDAAPAPASATDSAAG